MGQQQKRLFEDDARLVIVRRHKVRPERRRRVGQGVLREPRGDGLHELFEGGQADLVGSHGRKLARLARAAAAPETALADPCSVDKAELALQLGGAAMEITRTASEVSSARWFRQPRLWWILPLALAAGIAAAPTGHAQSVFFGTLHSHTSYSDGSGKPREAFAYARDVAHLDYLAITEHNHALAEAGASADRKDGLLIAIDHDLYNGAGPESLLSAAASESRPGAFVALYGEEFSSISSGNHANVFDAPSVIDTPNGDFKKMLAWVDTHPGSDGQPPIVQLNHPHDFQIVAKDYGRDDFPNSQHPTESAWRKAINAHASLMEVLNGPAMSQAQGIRSANVQEKDFFGFLNRGLRVAPSAGQDNHYKTWGTVTDARAAIVADNLTREDLLSAMRARHVYATEDKNLRVIGRVNGHLMGDIIDPPTIGSELDISLSIKDDDEPTAHYVVDVFRGVPGSGPVTSPVVHIAANGDTTTPLPVPGVRFTAAHQYIVVRITQTGSGTTDHAWLAPVWFETSN